MSEAPDDEQEIDLSALNDEDLTAQMHDDLYDGMADEIVEGTEDDTAGTLATLQAPVATTTARHRHDPLLESTW